MPVSRGYMRALYPLLMALSLRKHRVVQARGPRLTVVFLVFSEHGICGQNCNVFRNFRLFLHSCELHVQPWLSRLPVFDIQQASVRMPPVGYPLSCASTGLPQHGHLV